MTKEQRIKELDEMELDAVYQLVFDLEEKLELMKNKSGRKSEVLGLIKHHGKITILQISEILGISTKNVSSQLTYLRQEGVNICTDVNGKKFIINED